MRMLKAENIYIRLTICFALAIAVFALYWPVKSHEFLSLDDDVYITKNFHVRQGPVPESLKWAFTTNCAANWHPLTWISHMVDCFVFGLDPTGPHFVNVFLHAINTVLLFLLFRSLTGQVWPSFFVAAVFAFHPLHVESVAWAAERKDVLSTLFWFLTSLTYLHWLKCKKTGWYLLMMLLFAMGLMAKPMLVTLPFVLLLLDYWPLQRFGFVTDTPKKKSNTANLKPSGFVDSIIPLIKEKIPLIALSLASCVTTIIVQRTGGAMATFDKLPIHFRIGNAFISYADYILKTIWPVKLAVLYPHPLERVSWPAAAISVAVLAMISFAVYKFRTRKWLVVGWLWYIGTLIPVIGFVQVGVQSMADRYMYIPIIGLSIMVAWPAAELASRWKYQKLLLGLLMGVLIVAMMLVTRKQLTYWQNSMVLYKHSLDVTKDNFTVHDNLGVEFAAKGEYAQAEQQFVEALRIRPTSANAHNNLANSLSKIGKFEDAKKHALLSINYMPNLHLPYGTLGALLAREGKIPEAIEYFKKSIQLNPMDPRTHHVLGYVYASQHKYDLAEACFLEALRLEPNFYEARINLAELFANEGKLPQAVEQYYLALQIKGPNPKLFYEIGRLAYGGNNFQLASESLANALSLEPNNPQTLLLYALTIDKFGKTDDSINILDNLLAADPNNPELNYQFGMLLIRNGKVNSAIKYFREAVRLKPEVPELQNSLAVALATATDPNLRNLTDAASSAEQACRITDYNNPIFLDTLSVIYSCTGNFDKAISIAEKAVGLARTAKLNDLAKTIEKRLENYKNHLPYDN